MSKQSHRVTEIITSSRNLSLSPVPSTPCSCLTNDKLGRRLKDDSRFANDVTWVGRNRKENTCRPKDVDKWTDGKMMVEEKRLKGCTSNRVRKRTEEPKEDEKDRREVSRILNGRAKKRGLKQRSAEAIVAKNYNTLKQSNIDFSSSMAM